MYTTVVQESRGSDEAGLAQHKFTFTSPSGLKESCSCSAHNARMRAHTHCGRDRGSVGGHKLFLCLRFVFAFCVCLVAVSLGSHGRGQPASLAPARNTGDELLERMDTATDDELSATYGVEQCPFGSFVFA